MRALKFEDLSNDHIASEAVDAVPGGRFYHGRRMRPDVQEAAASARTKGDGRLTDRLQYPGGGLQGPGQCGKTRPVS